MPPVVTVALISYCLRVQLAMREQEIRFGYVGFVPPLTKRGGTGAAPRINSRSGCWRRSDLLVLTRGGSATVRLALDTKRKWLPV